MRQSLREIIKDLDRGVMEIHPDIIVEGDDLPFDHVGSFVFRNAEDVIKFTGARIDPAYVQRLVQVDFTRSTVVGVSLGERPAGHRVEVEKIVFDAKDNTISVKAVETSTGSKEKDGVTQVVSFPFVVFRFVSSGNAKVDIKVKAL